MERFRLEDENEIKPKVFARVSKKNYTPESFIILSLTEKVGTVIYTEGG